MPFGGPAPCGGVHPGIRPALWQLDYLRVMYSVSFSWLRVGLPTGPFASGLPVGAFTVAAERGLPLGTIGMPGRTPSPNAGPATYLPFASE